MKTYFSSSISLKNNFHLILKTFREINSNFCAFRFHITPSKIFYSFFYFIFYFKAKIKLFNKKPFYFIKSFTSLKNNK